MPLYNEEMRLPSNLNTRQAIRKFVVLKFLQENPGQGKGELASKYHYIVEYCISGRIIKIKRPALLNKGMDFTVHLEGIEFKSKGPFKDRPKHEEIINDLLIKKQHRPIEYEALKSYILDIYNCQNIDLNLLRELDIPFGILTCEEVCLVLKWLFIEQDITYWNWSGRNMLYQHLENNNLI